ncbi:cupin domain-containing protein [Gandjariella thermophila]|uniref:Cupin n=1 Tax=Gandjariella thermophila TaxID=1931992 RepID=A0A4D4JBE5_9PSEU|nr:cupin domain-containing protein [Gandjariella thermophila]GDY31756.1 cupin [Gandjariella thermophila]
MPKRSIKVAMSEVTPSRRQGGKTRALLTPTSVSAISGFMGTVTLEDGERVAECYHPYSDKFLFVVRGSLLFRIDGEEVTAGENEALLITRGQRHSIENVGTTQAFVVYQITPLAPRPEWGHVDTEPVPFPDDAPPRVGGTE